jgi:iron(III) transport system ATP-binding protein
MAAIHIENVTVGYDGKPIIEQCSLTIADGSLFTLLGPSGCGKTTLLRTLAGFIPVMSGRIRFGEGDVTHATAHTRDVGMVFQDYALFPDKTVFDNVAYGLRARKRDEPSIAKTVGEYLERVGLTGYEARRPAELSGGQRQRVALARALAIKPTVLLMDEPLSNLDAKLRGQVRETIADLQKEVGITTVLVTHDQEEALALSDRIGLMRSGALEQVGTPHELYGMPTSAYVADFVGAANVIPVTLPHDVVAGEQFEVGVAGHAIAVTAQPTLKAGSAALIARGETLMLRRDVQPNSVPVKVKRKQYLGARTLVTVELPSGATLHVETREDAPHIAVGAPLFVQFSAASSRVVEK